MDEDNQKEIPPKTIVMSEIMTPDMANFQGNVHGGHILSLLDKVAYVCASRYSGKLIVTLSVDQVTFSKAIHVGELVTFLASVNYVGNTSLEVGIRVIAENLLTRETRHTNTCYFTMVALDMQGKPTPVQPLLIQNEIEKKRYKQAIARKELRLKLRNESL